MTTENSPQKNVSKPRSYTITITAPKAMAYSIFALLGIIWIFVLGVILGRGYTPEETIPQIAELMPRQNASISNALTIISEEENISPEDAQKARQIIAQADEKYRASVAQAKTEQKKTEIPSADNNAGLKKQTSQGSTSLSAASSAQEKFDYTYQIASFKEADQAQALTAKLKADGINARVNQGSGKGQIWNRVVADLRATPAETDILKEKLKKYKINNILMLSKKTVK